MGKTEYQIQIWRPYEGYEIIDFDTLEEALAGATKLKSQGVEPYYFDIYEVSKVNE